MTSPWTPLGMNYVETKVLDTHQRPSATRGMSGIGRLRRFVPSRRGGSLTRRMIGIAALWITLLLVGGGFALDRVLTQSIVRNFDAQLEYVLNAMIGSVEVDDVGDLYFTRQLGDQRFLETYSGLYYQISGPGRETYESRSLWDRRLQVRPRERDGLLHAYDSEEFVDPSKPREEQEILRVVERDVQLPGSPLWWRLQIAQDRAVLDGQIDALRYTLVRSFGALGLGLIILAALQTIYGLWPLRRVRRAIAAVRSGETARINERFPHEIEPLTDEMNALLEHNERQAEEAREHAGNLAHALKTPLTVITGAAAARDPDLPDTICREAATMRRQVDHHLARARAVGRRAAGQSRTEVWPALEAVERAVARLYPNVTIDLAGVKGAAVRLERQDLDELLGNLIENAAKYGGGRVFVTVEAPDGYTDILVEDDGPGIPPAERESIFDRGKRLDSNKPGTGLGLAIVRDVVEIYGGAITLEESEDLGGLLARLRLPAA